MPLDPKEFNRQLRLIDNQSKELQRKREALIREQQQIHPDPQVSKFLERYAGKRLLELHKLDETGTWEVLGEDPNCDMAGPHVQPRLGFYEGTLEKVLVVAVRLPKFWCWGAGGDITKVEPNLVTKL